MWSRLKDPWGKELAGAGAATVFRLAELTGLSAGQIVRRVNHSRLEQAKVQIVVALVTREPKRPEDDTAGLIDFDP